MKKSKAQRLIADRKKEKSRKGFLKIPPEQWPTTGHDPLRTRVWQNSHYLIQEFQEEGDVIRLTVCRVTQIDGQWSDGITWDDLQAIKNAVGYQDACAVEIFPPAEHVVNVAAMRHLWVLPEPPEFMWRQS